MEKNEASFRKVLGGIAEKGHIVHPADVTLPFGPDAVALPLADL